MPFHTNVLHAQDQKASTVEGGNSSSDTEYVRTLNTLTVNEISGASLASNRITLPAGTYYIEASAPSYRSSRGRLTLYNYTDSVDEIIGPCCWNDSTAGGTSDYVMGIFTITAAKEFQLKHSIDGGTTSGLGLASDEGQLEIYCDVWIEQLSP